MKIVMKILLILNVFLDFTYLWMVRYADVETQPWDRASNMIEASNLDKPKQHNLETELWMWKRQPI